MVSTTTGMLLSTKLLEITPQRLAYGLLDGVYGALYMPQELSVSYQAVKTKVHRLMDAAVEGAKTESEIEECIARWWCLVQPADRAVARKYLLTVLERSNATLQAIATTLSELEGFAGRDIAPETLAESPAQPQSSPVNRV